MINGALKYSLGPGLAGYVRDISAYVQPWGEASSGDGEVTIGHAASFAGRYDVQVGRVRR